MPKPDYYDTPEADDQHDALKTEDSGATPAFLPKSVLMGKEFNVGDEVVLKITSIADDEIGVEYATEPASDKKDEEKTEPSDNPKEEASEGGSDTGSEMAMAGGQGESNSMYD